MSRSRFLEGGGEMGAAIEAFDWAHHPLGDFEGWPVALKTAVGTMLNSRFPSCIVWGAELVTIYNDAFRPILGNKHPALGRSFSDIWREVWPDIAPIVAAAFAGEATFIEDFPLVIDRFGRSENTFFTFCYSPIRDEHGVVRGMIDTVIETTGKVAAERNAQLVNQELDHRIKNILAMVGAVAGQTFRSATSVDEARRVFGERLAALSEAQTILTGASWKGAPVGDIIAAALRPHGIADDRIAMSGPVVDLGSDHALTLALAVHELTTNALKYGALSTGSGKVRVTWHDGPVDGAKVFVLNWTETGGPPVKPPPRSGFGSRLVERVVAEKFRGLAELSFEPDGLRYRIEAPMKDWIDVGPTGA